MPKTILVTAGPTREKIDPIRFLSNESSGVLGHEIAKAAKAKGYRVILILGPVYLPDIQGVKTIRIESARDLQMAVKKQLPKADVLFMTAAVSDFSPVKKVASKINRKNSMRVVFRQNPDILKSISQSRVKQNRIYFGFCLETDHLLGNAKRKLKSKKLDFMIALKYHRKRPPFGKVSFSPVLLSADGRQVKLSNITKSDLAKRLLKIAEKAS